MARPASLAAEVENPNLVALPTDMFAHPREGIAVEVARCADEADDAGAFGGVLLKNLPQCPAPEIDVEVIEVLDVDAVPSVGSGVEEIL